MPESIQYRPLGKSGPVVFIQQPKWPSEWNKAVRQELIGFISPETEEDVIRCFTNRAVPEFPHPIEGWEIILPVAGELTGCLLVTVADNWLYVVVDQSFLSFYPLVTIRDFADQLCHRDEMLMRTTVIVRGASENESERPFSFYPAVPKRKRWWERLPSIKKRRTDGVFTSDR